MDKTFEAPSSRFLPTLVVFVFVIGLLYTFFLVFERVSLNSSVASIEENKAELQDKMNALKDDKIAELYSAQELKTSIEEATTYWSQVLNNLNGLVPVGVFVSSYSASEDASIQVSGVADSFSAVADFISALSGSKDFESVFVPSVTSGVTSDGQDVVSFSLNAHNSSK